MKRKADSQGFEDQCAPKKIPGVPAPKKGAAAPKSTFEAGEGVRYIGEDWHLPRFERLRPGTTGTVMETSEGLPRRAKVKFPQLRDPLWCMSKSLVKTSPCATKLLQVNQPVICVWGDIHVKRTWGQVAGPIREASP